MIKEFNKKNLNDFADYLYKETAKGIEYVPLACGSMAAQQDDFVYCCVTAELYQFFTGKPAYSFDPKFSYVKEEADVRTLLVELSTCDVEDQALLENALDDLVDINDIAKEKEYSEEYIDLVGSEKEQIARAKRCSKACKKIAKKFLK